jgi:hypothetical protein
MLWSNGHFTRLQCSVTWYTYTVNDTVDAVQRAVSNYYALNAVSPDTFGYDLVPAYGNSSELVPSPPLLKVISYADVGSLFQIDGSFAAATATATYALNGTSYGPLDYSQGSDALRSFFNSLVTMELRLPNIHNFAFGTIYRNCMLWSVGVTYDFTNRGQLQ